MKKSYASGFLEEEIDEKSCNSKQKSDNESENGSGNDNDVPDQNCGSDNEEMETQQTQDPMPGSSKKQKKRKKGIIYVANIPKHMNVTRLRELLGQYGKIGRMYLQPEKIPEGDKKFRKKKRPGLNFTEGWVEFESKKVAKKIVELLNNKQISTRKRSQFYDCLWSMKYLPRFKWVHLTERLNYEQAVYKQRLMAEVSQARKETTFFQNNLDKSENLKKNNKKGKKIKSSVE